MSAELPELDDPPEGWATTSIRSVVTMLQYGISTKADTNAVASIPILRMSNIQDGYIDLSDLKYVRLADANASVRLARGDIIFNRTNSPELVGKAAVVDDDRSMTFASYLIRLRCRPELAEPRLVCRWINSAWGREWAARVRTDGVSQSNINGTKLAEMTVPLAPLAEQRRIVAQVEALLEQVIRAKGRLERVTGILKRFRQAVLAAACSGELTREWRTERGHAPHPAASDEDVPSDWTLASPDDVAAATPNALAIGPFGSNLKVSDYCTSGTPLVFVRDIRAESFGGAGTKYVSETKARELRSHAVRPGDLLITKMGEPPGDTALYPNDRLPGIITADCIKLTTNTNVASASYMRLCLRAEPARGQMLERSMGVAQQKLSLARFREIRFRLPGIDEQAEIVRQVDRLFTLAGTIERHVAAAAARADKLPQAILSKAFSGELVPTEAELARAEGREYETAEALLARVARPPTSMNSNRRRTNGE